jgi:hypothetical protein
MVIIIREKRQIERQINELDQQINELVKKKDELIQKKEDLKKTICHVKTEYKVFNALPECINCVGFYPHSKFDINNQPKKIHKMRNPFLSMPSYNPHLIDATRQVIIKQFINTATDEVHKKAFELCLKSLDNMRKENYPENTYPITPLTKPQYAKIWIIATVILIEEYDNLEALSYFNECIEPFTLHFTAYAHLYYVGIKT